jgi:hypothetical protein
MTSYLDVGLSWNKPSVAHASLKVKIGGDLAVAIFPRNKPRVPHISLVFREMWDTATLNPSLLDEWRTRRYEPIYPANLSVAATRARLFVGSEALCPPSGVIISSASGHARWSAQALSMGHTTS